MKIVNRASLSTDLENALRLEVAILNELDHPNILSLVETFSTIKAHYLVTELLEGGELFDRIIEKVSSLFSVCSQINAYKYSIQFVGSTRQHTPNLKPEM